MASLLNRAASAAGINISDGQIVLSEEQIASAQALVRQLLKSSGGSGKSISGMRQNWRVVGEPVLEIYGWKIGLAISAIISVGIFIGYQVGKK
jgi:hypothetical protein